MQKNQMTSRSSLKTIGSSHTRQVVGVAILALLLTLCAMPLAYPTAPKEAMAFLSGQGKPGPTANLQYEKLTTLLREELKCQTYWTRTRQVAQEGDVEHAVQLYRLALLTRLDQHARIHEIKRLLPLVHEQLPQKQEELAAQLELLPFDITTELHLLYTLKMECYRLIVDLQSGQIGS